MRFLTQTKLGVFCHNPIQRYKMDTNMEGTTSFEPEMAQIKVTFTTTEDDFQLPESKRQLLVPAGTSDSRERPARNQTVKQILGIRTR